MPQYLILAWKKAFGIIPGCLIAMTIQLECSFLMVFAVKLTNIIFLLFLQPFMRITGNFPFITPP